jgi:hypothetical protein
MFYLIYFRIIDLKWATATVIPLKLNSDKNGGFLKPKEMSSPGKTKKIHTGKSINIASGPHNLTPIKIYMHSGKQVPI